MHEGDPLSPSLPLCPCHGALSHCISYLVEEGFWKPIQLTHCCPVLSYLFFADDLLLFGEAFVDHIMVMKQFLDVFCVASGQKMNFYKSKIFFSTNVSDDLLQQICDVASIYKSDEIDMYFEVPMIHDQITRHAFSPLLHKVDYHLAR